MAVAEGTGLPIAVSVGAASPNEVTLVEATLGARFLAESPERLIGDQAYDSDPLNQRLAERGIEMIAPRQLSPTAQACVYPPSKDTLRGNITINLHITH